MPCATNNSVYPPPPMNTQKLSGSLHVWVRRPGASNQADTYEGNKAEGTTAAANIVLAYVDAHYRVSRFGSANMTIG